MLILHIKLHNTNKMENWLGTFYLEGLRLRNLGESSGMKDDLIRQKITGERSRPPLNEGVLCLDNAYSTSLVNKFRG